MPILGLPLVNFTEGDQRPVGRKVGQMLWNVLIGSILHGKNTTSDDEDNSESEKEEGKVNAQDILLVNMLD